MDLAASLSLGVPLAVLFFTSCFYLRVLPNVCAKRPASPENPLSACWVTVNSWFVTSFRLHLQMPSSGVFLLDIQPSFPALWMIRTLGTWRELFFTLDKTCATYGSYSNGILITSSLAFLQTESCFVIQAPDLFGRLYI